MDKEESSNLQISLSDIDDDVNSLKSSPENKKENNFNRKRLDSFKPITPSVRTNMME